MEISSKSVDFGKKPKFVICFICGREFGLNSLEIHVKQCREKSENKPEIPDLYINYFAKIKSGDTISLDEVNSFNSVAENLFKEISLIPCAKCGRRFAVDRLDVHQRSCKVVAQQPQNVNAKKSSIASGNVKDDKGRVGQSQNIKPVAKTNTTVQSSNESNKIFLEKLEKQLNAEEKEKVTSNSNSASGSNNVSIKAAENNTNSNQIFLEKLEKQLKSEEKVSAPSEKAGGDSSSKISNDSNKIFLEKLEKQLKIEEKGGSSSSGGAGSNFGNKPLSLMCYLCGKEYGTSSLTIHLKACEITWVQNHKNHDPDSLRPECLETILECVKNKSQIDPNILEEYNRLADKKFKDISYKSCPNCGRRFAADRLEVHLKGCKSKVGSTAKEVVKSKRGSSVDATSNSTKIFEEKLLKQLGGGYGSESGSTVSTSKITSGAGKPLFLMCFLCGREFGKHSLEIHLKTCAEKNSNISATPPKELTDMFNKLAEDGETAVTNDEMINYNEVAEKIFKEKTMKSCPGCKRKFLPDRLEVHLKSCKLAEGRSSSNSPSPKMTSRPILNMCPLCGREFGSKSLPIHLKSCKDKFDLEQKQLPKNQRRSAEKVIEKFQQSNASLKSKGTYNIDNMNQETFEIYKKEALVPCERCGRTFLPDRLIVHLRSCKGAPVKKEAKK